MIREILPLLLFLFACSLRLLAIEVEDVDVFIGTIEPGHVTPAAACPFGMVQAGPDTSPTESRFETGKAHCSGYDFRDEWVWRFSQTHLEGTGCAALGDFGILPMVDGFDGRNRPAKLLKETEKAEPGAYSATLVENNEQIQVKVCARPHSAVYRFSYPRKKSARLLVDLDWGLVEPSADDCFGKKVYSCASEFPSECVMRGGHHVKCWNEYELHFAMRFSSPVVRQAKVDAADGLRGDVYELDFGILEDGVLEVRLGLSYTSPESAERNLDAEIASRSLDEMHAETGNDWRKVLSKVVIDSDTPLSTKQSFCAAFYRLHFQPNLISDVGQSPRYSTFSLWDTFRAAHPLYTIVDSVRTADFVNSLLDQFDRQGYLPIWSLAGRENHCMIGHHSVPVIVDAFLKGVEGVDWTRAFSAVKDSLTRNHQAQGDGTWGLLKEDWDVLDRYGYYPYDLMRGAYGGRTVKGESVSRVLECAYDDACAARLAKGLGKDSDAEFFQKRSENWKNVFDPSVGFMRGKDSAGRWRTPFSPWSMGSGPWRENDFCEGNSWQYSWHVMQDPEGLIARMGGQARFIEKLEALFSARPLGEEDGESYDATGLIGQYAHGNEPSHHVAYFFTLAGRQDLTGRYVRQIFETQYRPCPDGLCGNDDCGQMAAWYIFSALGFYPFDPCGGEYVLGSPQVPRAEIELPDGKTFSVIVRNFRNGNGVVSSVRLNGKPLTGGKLTHADIMRGGVLVFEMAEEPGSIFDCAAPKRLCAHRGIPKAIPENTLPGFAAAVALGASEIELDIWWTKDGEIVSIHDLSLERVSNGTGKVYEKTYAELRELDFGFKKGKGFAGLKIVRFSDILEKLAGRTIMNIHVKSLLDTPWNERHLKKVIDLIDAYDARGQVYFMTENEVLQDQLARLAPDVVRCMGHDGRYPARIVERALAHKCQMVQLYKPYFDQTTIDRAHAAGIRCNVFYSDDEAEARRFLQMGIDTILTNDYIPVSEATGLR